MTVKRRDEHEESDLQGDWYGLGGWLGKATGMGWVAGCKATGMLGG